MSEVLSLSVIDRQTKRQTDRTLRIAINKRICQFLMKVPIVIKTYATLNWKMLYQWNRSEDLKCVCGCILHLLIHIAVLALFVFKELYYIFPRCNNYTRRLSCHTNWWILVCIGQNSFFKKKIYTKASHDFSDYTQFVYRRTVWSNIRMRLLPTDSVTAPFLWLWKLFFLLKCFPT